MTREEMLDEAVRYQCFKPLIRAMAETAPPSGRSKLWEEYFRHDITMIRHHFTRISNREATNGVQDNVN